MNEGYRLTDFTLEELSLLNVSVSNHIDKLRPTSHYHSDGLRIETLFDMQARILTAFSIVKDREKVMNQ